jgi:hypothetical protein
MIRLSEIKLPLTEAEHPEPALRAACARLLGVAPDAITSLCVFKRSYDARKRQLMAGLHRRCARWPIPRREAALLARLGKHPRIAPAPDMNYVAPVRAPRDLAQRPVVVGLRALRHLRGAGAGADGLLPDRARARQAGARTHQGHLGPVAQAC